MSSDGRGEPPGPSAPEPSTMDTEPSTMDTPAVHPSMVGDPVDAPAGPPRTEPAPTVAEIEDRWRRALADLDNLRKRYARELASAQATERAQVATAFLPVLDNLERALEHADPDGNGVVAGVRAVRDQAVAVLAALGYPRHAETGVPFDPHRHEAVAVESDPHAPQGTVVRVLRPGYGDAGAQLRPAAVVVSGGPG